jgi:positive regulator of sigma E activity
MPVAGLLGAGTYGLADLFGSGVLSTIVIVLGLAGAVWYAARLRRMVALKAAG